MPSMRAKNRRRRGAGHGGERPRVGNHRAGRAYVTDVEPARPRRSWTPAVLAVLAVGACAGAGGGEWRGTAEPEVAGERVAWAPFEVAPPPVTTGEAGDGERARHGDADPCAGEVEPQLRALCTATSHDDHCVGFDCVRTEPRTALECLLEHGEPDATFVALSRAGNPATRLYAREALLRRDAMTLGLVAEGLTDDGVATTESACIRNRAALTEPAFVALLQLHGAQADALLAGFLDSTLGHALLFEHRGDRVPVLQLALFAVRDPSRSAAVRALRVELEREMAAALEPHWPRERVEDFRKSFDPAIAHTRWTAAHGCDPRRPIEMPDEAQEAAEAARLLQLERDLAAQQP
ncbi:MAG: hypothetical protein KBB21_09775 [Nannocystaceae bacterium]|nr:hypothetical protein [Nannocystaceae bacterium]